MRRQGFRSLKTILLLFTRSYAWVPRLVPMISKTVLLSTKNPTKLNPLLDLIQPSKTVEIFSLVQELQAAGNTVTSLCVGEPDFGPPDSVLKVLQDASIPTKYTAVKGTNPLRQAIADDLKRRKGIVYDPNTEIVVSNGAKQVVYQSILALAGVGDAVIVPKPYWPSYPEQVKLCGAQPILVDSGEDFLLTASQLRTTLQNHPNTKLIILCHPSNPTGAVYTTEQLLELKEVLDDYPDVFVLADEIYEQLTYNTECVNIANIIGKERTITINGFSKVYAMTGFRLGYVAAPAPIISAISVIQGQLTSCASSIAQAAAVAALDPSNDAWIQARVKELQQKRDYVVSQLQGMPGVQLDTIPNGAFYVLPNVSAYCGNNDTQFCVDLLESNQLAIVPGSSFGAPGTVRISYATSMEELETAMKELSHFLRAERERLGLEL